MKNLPPEEVKKKSAAYLKYTSVGFQLLGSMAVGGFLGHWTDVYFKTTQAYYTAAGLLIFLLIGLYAAIKDLIKPS